LNIVRILVFRLDSVLITGCGGLLGSKLMDLLSGKCKTFCVDVDLPSKLKNLFHLDITNKKDKALTIILILSILASISALIYVIVTPKRGEKFTEFYILGPGGMADNYPKNLKIGENGTVIIGIVNHEYELINYTLQITLGDKLLKETTIKLNHNETFTENFTFSPKEKGRKKLKFLLYKGGSREPYRLLHLWIDVK